MCINLQVFPVVCRANMFRTKYGRIHATMTYFIFALEQKIQVFSFHWWWVYVLKALRVYQYCDIIMLSETGIYYSFVHCKTECCVRVEKYAETNGDASSWILSLALIDIQLEDAERKNMQPGLFNVIIIIKIYFVKRRLDIKLICSKRWLHVNSKI